MSDDLVKRLRSAARHPMMDNSCRADVFDVAEAADRIEELEAKLREMALDCLAAEGQAAEAYQTQLAAEAKLAKAVDALDWIGNHMVMSMALNIDHFCGMMERRARTTLAELKGEDRG
jgi:hypothetical protein